MEYNVMYILGPTIACFFGYIIRIERSLVKISTELALLKEQVEKWQQ